MPELSAKKIEYLTDEQAKEINDKMVRFSDGFVNAVPNLSPLLEIANPTTRLFESLQSVLTFRNEALVAATQFKPVYLELAMGISTVVRIESPLLRVIDEITTSFWEPLRQMVEMAQQTLRKLADVIVSVNKLPLLLPELKETFYLPPPSAMSYREPDRISSFLEEIDWSYIDEKNAREQQYQEAVIALASSVAKINNNAMQSEVGNWRASIGWRKDGKTFQITDGITLVFSSAENKRCVVFKRLTLFKDAWVEVKRLATLTNSTSDEVRQILSQIRDEKIKGKPAEDYISIESRDAQPGAYRILLTPIIEDN
ncbi:MAG: hypothetical protein ABI425_02315 [Patescibacteria group bacterium]